MLVQRRVAAREDRGAAAVGGVGLGAELLDDLPQTHARRAPAGCARAVPRSVHNARIHVVGTRVRCGVGRTSSAAARSPAERASARQAETWSRRKSASARESSGGADLLRTAALRSQAAARPLAARRAFRPDALRLDWAEAESTRRRVSRRHGARSLWDAPSRLLAYKREQRARRSRAPTAAHHPRRHGRLLRFG